ncbi:MAG TPA: FAD-dependent monooxygenase [Rhizobiaceae bacterium]|nr:FAD-dependent monooxygenase [Rhizobiaceae bacterium]
MKKTSGRVLIAGAGIAGLTVALAFANEGFETTIIERAERLNEVGAGLQLSPNATRILARLGVLDRLSPVSTHPRSVALRDAVSLALLAEVPLGIGAEERWKAPYLVLHRADLQASLLATVKERPNIHLELGATLRHVAFNDDGTAASIESAGKIEESHCDLLIGADGVWSTARTFVAGAARNRPSGKMAWRATLKSGDGLAPSVLELFSGSSVMAFLHPAAHLIAYPVKAGSEINLAVLMKGNVTAGSWSTQPDTRPLAKAMAKWAPPLASLPEKAGPWTAWPIHAVDPSGRWTDGRGITLIGDAAHAMTPFAAQGAAMAIEDAAVLASLVAATPENLSHALARYEELRRPRIQRVSRRGAFNHFAWHAAGPIALARNLVLKTRPPQKLAADLDWLYGWSAEI